MGSTFSFAHLVDIGFVIMVMAASWQSLSDATVKRSRRFKQEFTDLEHTIKGLVTEAAEASAALDRSLLRRKQELETLLKQIQQAQEEAAPAQELPNTSWEKQSIQKDAPKAKPVVPAHRAAKPEKRPEQPAPDDDLLEQLLAEKTDKV